MIFGPRCPRSVGGVGSTTTKKTIFRRKKNSWWELMPWWQFSIFYHNSFCNSIWQGPFHWPPSDITIWAIADHRYWGAFGFWRRWTTLEVKNRHKKKSITCPCLWVCWEVAKSRFFLFRSPSLLGPKYVVVTLWFIPTVSTLLFFAFHRAKTSVHPWRKL